MGFRMKTMHAGTTAAERFELAKEFNEPASELQMLICMFDVSTLGLNLQKTCSNVVIMASA